MPAEQRRPLIPLHPEPVADDEQAMRWVIPAGTLNFVGAVGKVPTSLQTLLDDGTLDGLDVGPASITTRLGAARGWRTHGARVRTALHAALIEPDHWSPVTEGSADERLRMAAREVIDGEVGAYIRSHGGGIELVGVGGHEVQVRLSGACAHCYASDQTLSERFESALRARYPELRGVTTASERRRSRVVLGFPGRRL